MLKKVNIKHFINKFLQHLKHKTISKENFKTFSLTQWAKKIKTETLVAQFQFQNSLKKREKTEKQKQYKQKKYKESCIEINLN